MIILRFYLNNECNFTLSLMYLLKTLKKKSFAWTCRNIRYINFPSASSPGMEGILFFHEDCLFILFFVLFLVLGILYFIIINSDSSIKNVEKSWFEIAWTFIPTIIILLLIVPSFFFGVLPSLEMGVIKPACIPNVNFRGPQGYWEYDYTTSHLLDTIPMQYDSSYPIHDSSLQYRDFLFSNMRNTPVIYSPGDKLTSPFDEGRWATGTYQLYVGSNETIHGRVGRRMFNWRNSIPSITNINRPTPRHKWFSRFRWAFRCCLPRRSAGKDGDSL